MRSSHAQPSWDAERRSEGYFFDFFQLVHLLETWRGGTVALGGIGPYRAEALRLRPDSSLLFSPADIRLVEAADEEAKKRFGFQWDFRVTVNFMGVYGVASPSPVYLTELIGFTDVDAEELTDFLDLFNHRLLALFYRSWLKYRYPYRFEPGGRDEVSGYLLSYIGYAEPAVRESTGLPSSRLLRYLGLLALPTRPPVGLELMVSDHFGGIGAKVQEQILRWVTIPPEQRNRLGQANSGLGTDLCVGAKVPDRSGKLRLSLGPLHFKEYLQFLPGTKKFREAQALVRLWCGDRFDFDLEFIVHREEVPELQMGSGSLGRLGWTSWVTSQPGLAADPRILFPGSTFAERPPA